MAKKITYAKKNIRLRDDWDKVSDSSSAMQRPEAFAILERLSLDAAYANFQNKVRQLKLGEAFKDAQNMYRYYAGCELKGNIDERILSLMPFVRGEDCNKLDFSYQFEWAMLDVDTHLKIQKADVYGQEKQRQFTRIFKGSCVEVHIEWGHIEPEARYEILVKMFELAKESRPLFKKVEQGTINGHEDVQDNLYILKHISLYIGKICREVVGLTEGQTNRLKNIISSPDFDENMRYDNLIKADAKFNLPSAWFG